MNAVVFKGDALFITAIMGINICPVQTNSNKDMASPTIKAIAANVTIPFFCVRIFIILPLRFFRNSGS